MDNAGLVIKIKKAIDFVSGHRNRPSELMAYFKDSGDSGTTPEEFVKILGSIEEKGFINPINAITWRPIYDACKVTFPEDLAKR